MFTLTSITTQPVVCTRGISRAWLQQIGPALVVVDWKPFFRWDLLGRSRFLAALARHLSECFEVAAGWKEACAHDPWRRLCAPSVHTVVVPFFWTGLILYLESYRKERCAKVLLRYYAKGACPVWMLYGGHPMTEASQAAAPVAKPRSPGLTAAWAKCARGVA